MSEWSAVQWGGGAFRTPADRSRWHFRTMADRSSAFVVDPHVTVSGHGFALVMVAFRSFAGIFPMFGDMKWQGNRHNASHALEHFIGVKSYRCQPWMNGWKWPSRSYHPRRQCFTFHQSIHLFRQSLTLNHCHRLIVSILY